jgi:mannose-1-phosphate guanylyltransferase/mannose-6-phosphate isomerase
MYPKQFIRFFNGEGRSLLGSTLERIGGDVSFAAPIVVCNNDHRFLVREELARAGLEPQAVMLEPIARNTAAAVAAAALFAVRQDADAILLVMPSDHVIADTVGFLEDVHQAAQIAATGRLVLFGVKADEPRTGYGYIRQGAALNGANGGFAVDEFREKPDRAKAEGYLAAGGYFWNSGIFVLSARAYLAELERLDPAIYKAARGALQDATQDMDFLRLDQTAFAASPNISIDYAVMEKTKAAAMLPLDVGWSDVGSWSSLWEIAPHDEHGNAVEGDAVLIDTSNSLLRSERSLVAAIGVDNLVIVDTPDALLVADKSRSQEVSAIVAKLKQSNRKEHEQHLRNYRPWGYFETLSIGGRFQVKLLHVEPGGKLSMQMHHHRSEHWVVVRGTARVTVGDGVKLVQENESVYITATHWHRLENPGKVPLEIIEVQLGSYLGEDDIIRADDVYNRAPDETK